MSKPSNYIAPNGMSAIERALAACEAKERKDAVIAKMIAMAIALPAEHDHPIGEGVEAYVTVFEIDDYEYRDVQIIADGNTVAALTWHGYFTTPDHSEHMYQPGAWEAVVLADDAACMQATV
jgi:hypothetical protein